MWSNRENNPYCSSSWSPWFRPCPLPFSFAMWSLGFYVCCENVSTNICPWEKDLLKCKSATQTQNFSAKKWEGVKTDIAPSSPHHIVFCHNTLLKKSDNTLAPISSGSTQSYNALISFTCSKYHLLVAYSVPFLTGLSPSWRKKRLQRSTQILRWLFQCCLELLCWSAAMQWDRRSLCTGYLLPLVGFFFLLFGGSDICLGVNSQLIPSAL